MSSSEQDEKSDSNRSRSATEAATTGADVATSIGVESSYCDWSGCGDGCSICDCSALLQLSSLLLLAAAVVPDAGGGVVRALIRSYQRWLTRFTPRCPSTPSCSAYAITAVEDLGPRRGLAAAARRVRECGR
ncbi:membrane protein insertion efficiency factor YidD [Pseudonocardia sp. TRM90224]|uniref:membrane protein insertion efficiency factor YidD n=1 Tax=Pseudonocardia sp. TRM90224 TaxID=2812678 RepID=UPI0035A993F2